MINELLFYGGIILIVITVIAAAIFYGCFYIAGKKLKEKLNKEYGKKK